MSAKTVGETLNAVVGEQIASERAARASVITRSAIVITGSGTLVTVCLVAAALVTRVQTFQVPTAALVLVGVAVVLFVLAALVALAINAPRRLPAIDVAKSGQNDDLRDWSTADERLEIATYHAYIELLDELTASNSVLARLLATSLFIACGASASLTAAAVILLSSR